MSSDRNSYSIFKGNASVTFKNNVAAYIGGAACIEDNSFITFKEYTVAVFAMNSVVVGTGASIYAAGNCNITMEENTVVTFKHNYAAGKRWWSHVFYCKFCQ